MQIARNNQQSNRPSLMQIESGETKAKPQWSLAEVDVRARGGLRRSAERRLPARASFTMRVRAAERKPRNHSGAGGRRRTCERGRLRREGEAAARASVRVGESERGEA
ncbi:hypothetical protein L484_022959 [Morus notabilis]|uniref:Uncharacterized protein n=1 Tax=Morus notabilis TaxID=981085 RepID=W9R1F7_9ROSA|nr:hypothetical protein L484_022959 [Morus notabilis]